jgi:nicotinate-nucleotide adenylyltransferase
VRIGILGGTFDPPHLGHLIAAQDACAALELDRLIFVPAAEPPHKRDRAVTEARLRLDMLKAAVADNPSFELSTLELQRSGPSYTIATLRELHGRHPADSLYLLIGVDQVREFSTWREPEGILELAEVVMLARAGSEQSIEGADFVRQVVAVTRIDVSSTLIRSRVAAGQSIRYLVPDAVAEIIQREGLYR